MVTSQGDCTVRVLRERGPTIDQPCGVRATVSGPGNGQFNTTFRGVLCGMTCAICAYSFTAGAK